MNFRQQCITIYIANIPTPSHFHVLRILFKATRILKLCLFCVVCVVFVFFKVLKKTNVVFFLLYGLVNVRHDNTNLPSCINEGNVLFNDALSTFYLQ